MRIIIRNNTTRIMEYDEGHSIAITHYNHQYESWLLSSSDHSKRMRIFDAPDDEITGEGFMFFSRMMTTAAIMAEIERMFR